MAEQLVSREGKRVPDVAFRVRRNGDWATVTTDEIFAGKNVVVFSLPGAFTPTCSSTHLPRFNELAPAFKAQRRRRDRLHLGQRPVRDGTNGRKDQEADNIVAAARRQRRVHREDGHARRQDRPRASASARGATRCWCATASIEKMFIEPREAGRPVRGVGRRHDARLHQPERDASPTRWRSSRAKAARSARRRRSC